MLSEYFPFVVREKPVWELIVFNFQSLNYPLLTFIDEVVNANEFLRYSAAKQEVVDRVLMNLYPNMLAQSGRRSYRELRKLAGHDEEKLTVLDERHRSERSEVAAPAGVAASPVASSASAKQPSRASSVRFPPNVGGVIEWGTSEQIPRQRCRLRETVGGTGAKSPPGTPF